MIFKFFNQLVKILLLTIFLHSCGGLPKPDWGKRTEVDGRKRAQQNVVEGKGLNLFKSKKENAGNFSFASSNPLWRASLDVIDFMGLSSIDYAGGLIITDWYSEDNFNESIKITLRFLSSEVRVDAMKIDIRRKVCRETNKCITNKIESDLETQIRDKILTKAAKYKIDFDKEIKQNRPKKVFSNKDG